MDLMVRAPLFLNQSLRVGAVELFGCDWEGATCELGFTLILIGPNFRDCRWTDFDALQTWLSVTHFLTQVAIDSLHILCTTRQDEAYSDYARRWRRRPHRKVQQVSQHQALGRMASACAFSRVTRPFFLWHRRTRMPYYHSSRYTLLTAFEQVHWWLGQLR